MAANRAANTLHNERAVDEAMEKLADERRMAGVSDNCLALNCNTPILGAEPYHLRGFCSEACELCALEWKKKFGSL